MYIYNTYIYTYGTNSCNFFYLSPSKYVHSENKIVSVLEMIQKELHQEQYIGNYLTQQHAGNDLAIQHTVNSEPGNIKHPFNII